MKMKSAFSWILITAILIAQCAAFKSVKVDKLPRVTTVNLKVQEVVEFRLTREQVTQINNNDINLFVVVDQQKKSPVSFTVTGEDPLGLKYKEASAKQITGMSSLRTGYIVIIGKGSPIWSDAQTSWSVFLKLHALSNATSVEVTFFAAAEAPLLNGEIYTAMVEGLQSFKFGSQIVHVDGNHHFKFMIDALELSNTTSMEAFGWKGASSQASNKFNFTRFDQGKLGYVLDKTDSQYCQSGSCKYHVQVSLNNVKRVDLYVGEHTGGEVLRAGGHSVRLDNKDRIHQGRQRKGKLLHLLG